MVIRQQLQQAFLVVGLALPWVVPFGVWAQADTFEVTAATRFEAVDNPEQETDFAAQIRENQWRGIWVLMVYCRGASPVLRPIVR